MNNEEALESLQEIKQRREKLLREKLFEEKCYWSSKYHSDKYFLEKQIIHELCEKAQIPSNLGKNLNVLVSLENTKISGSNYVNIEQLLRVMQLVGIQIAVERNCDRRYTYIIASVMEEKAHQCFISSSVDIDIDDEELNVELFEGKHHDWFLAKLGSYWNYKSSAEGRKETETQIAMNYYDILTNDWNGCANGDILRESSPIASTNWVSPSQELNDRFGNFDNVLEKLKVALSETGFEMYLNQNSHYKPGENLQICMREKDYILDSINEQAKVLQK